MINIAYDILSDPDKKKQFDRSLKYAYEYVERPKRPDPFEAEQKRKRDLYERMQSYERRKKNLFVKRYEKGLKIFPSTFRFTILGLLLLTQVLLAIKFWFINEAVPIQFVMLTVVITSFVITTVILTAQCYRFWRYRFFVSKRHKNYELKSIRMMAVMIAMFPVLLYVIGEFTRDYHIKHYGVKYIADIEFLDVPNSVTYTFQVDGIQYSRTEKMKKGTQYGIKYGWVAIVYSKKNPRISKLNLKWPKV